MSESNKIAIITGGASGIGFAVGEALRARKDWTIHLLDRDVAKGQAAAESLAARFHEVNVADYSALATAFGAIFAAHGKLNFVFANAGIAVDMTSQQVQVSSKTSEETADGPPKPPSMNMLAVNLHSVIYTTTLAQYYFRQCPITSEPRSIIVTASSASFYASPIAPMYCASKHGVLGWVRSIASSAWEHDHVSINAICPGIVRTSILPAEMYKMFLELMLTPIHKVVEVVLMLLDGEGATKVDETSLFGQAVEICGMNHYHREQIEYCDATMAAVMGAN